ncbi:hypothetical protein ECDEC8C_6516 [Escherichia coli DEC8C]|nr:hypothetical protein ECDEC8C_6516 [Escherichia coli DEC8C]
MYCINRVHEAINISIDGFILLLRGDWPLNTDESPNDFGKNH